MTSVSRVAAAHQLFCTFTVQSVNITAREYTVDTHIALVAKAGANITAALAALPPSLYMSRNSSPTTSRNAAVAALLRFKYGQCRPCVAFADPTDQLSRTQSCVSSGAILSSTGVRFTFTHAIAYSTVAVWLECAHSHSRILSVEVDITHAINVNVA